jgi:hypothetical protein
MGDDTCFVLLRAALSVLMDVGRWFGSSDLSSTLFFAVCQRNHLNHHNLLNALLLIERSGKVSGKIKLDRVAESQSHSAKAGLQFPVGRIHRLPKKGTTLNESVLAHQVGFLFH